VGQHHFIFAITLSEHFTVKQLSVHIYSNKFVTKQIIIIMRLY